MKRLALIVTILLMMGVCSTSYSTVLCYNVYGLVRAVDTQADELDRTVINGFLVVDINESEGALYGSSLLLYGRDEQGAKVYRVYDDVTNMTLSGNALALVINAGEGCTIILTGNMRERRFGYPSRLNVNAANYLEGSLQIQSGMLLDLNQTLVGSGYLTAILNLDQTRNAQTNGTDVWTLSDQIIDRLESRGYVMVTFDEPQPM
jgi:hypothetical protein